MPQLPLNARREGLRSATQVAIWWAIGVALLIIPVIVLVFMAMMMNHMM